MAQGEPEQAFAKLDDEQRIRLKARLPEFSLVAHDAGDTRERIRVALPRQVGDLDPYNASAGLEVNFTFQVFSRLIDLDSHTQRLVPALAHHWRSERNGTVWHLWLRPGVRFHDGSQLSQKKYARPCSGCATSPVHFRNYTVTLSSSNWEQAGRLRATSTSQTICGRTRRPRQTHPSFPGSEMETFQPCRSAVVRSKSRDIVHID